MKLCDVNKIKNKKPIVLLPDLDEIIKDSVEYSFNNVIYLDYEPKNEDVESFVDYINNSNNTLILFDYCEAYRLILPYIKKNRRIYWVFKNNVSTITDFWSRDQFDKILNYYERNIIDSLICLDYSTYKVLKNSGYRVKYIKLDVKPNKKRVKKSKSIGLLGYDYNPNHNFYNQLSAIKMVDYSYVKLLKSMPATKHFIEFFDIREKEVDKISDTISDNDVNLYCNFTYNCYELILKSMDMGIPCLVGNTDFFDSNKKLKKYLVLNSDDDIGEIADRINLVRENKKVILDEYKKFRSKYSEQSVNSIAKL